MAYITRFFQREQDAREFAATLSGATITEFPDRSHPWRVHGLKHYAPPTLADWLKYGRAA